MFWLLVVLVACGHHGKPTEDGGSGSDSDSASGAVSPSCTEYCTTERCTRSVRRRLFSS